MTTFEYREKLYPEYLKHGNAMQFIEPVARQLCLGRGLDVGASRWPLPGSIPVEMKDGGSAYDLPEGPFDYVFSSHCLEHLENPVGALEHWLTRLSAGGCLFLYLPHPDMEYWRPENCRRHLHLFRPKDVAAMLRSLGLERVMHSERDMAWSFCAVGFKGEG